MASQPTKRCPERSGNSEPHARERCTSKYRRPCRPPPRNRIWPPIADSCHLRTCRGSVVRAFQRGHAGSAVVVVIVLLIVCLLSVGWLNRWSQAERAALGLKKK